MMYSTMRLTTLLKISPTPHAGGSFGGATAALEYTSGGNRSTARLVSFGETDRLIRLNGRLIDHRYQANDIDGQREGRNGHSASVFRKD